MKLLISCLLFMTFGCGRPSSTEQENNELQERKQQERLVENFEIVSGTYIGELRLKSTSDVYHAVLELKVINDIDPTTNLPLKPKLAGSLLIYERKDEEAILSYGVTQGSFDSLSSKLTLKLSNNLTIEGTANQNTLEGVLHSSLRGNVGELNLVWEE